jgi:hypothetical protein
MAASRKATAKKQTKLTIAKDLGVIHIDNVVVKQNVKGTDYIPTPHGAVYSRLDEIKPGLHKVVELSNGMLALNRPQRQDIMKFLTEQREETGWSIADLRDFYGV